MRALIVDDEPLARQLIREYLADFPQVQVLTECGDGENAVKTINAERPDLVFLDVQMPGLSGFEVLGRLDFMPAIIFSTAYDKFALRAFEINAVDYLLKPYARERFAQAVRRALERKGRINLDSF
ncbi:MAG: response regulator [Gemmatimonadetes bacterium]|nr:response regulator [Gemmatimonadota bacterium]